MWMYWWMGPILNHAKPTVISEDHPIRGFFIWQSESPSCTRACFIYLKVLADIVEWSWQIRQSDEFVEPLSPGRSVW